MTEDETEVLKRAVRRWAHCACAPYLRFWPGDRDAERCRPPLPECRCEPPKPETRRKP